MPTAHSAVYNHNTPIQTLAQLMGIRMRRILVFLIFVLNTEIFSRISIQSTLLRTSFGSSIRPSGSALGTFRLLKHRSSYSSNLSITTVSSTCEPAIDTNNLISCEIFSLGRDSIPVIESTKHCFCRPVLANSVREYLEQPFGLIRWGKNIRRLKIYSFFISLHQ